MAEVAENVIDFEEDGTMTPPDDGGLPADSPVVLAAIVLGVLLCMGLLFSFALLIDCRNQQAEAERKKSSTQRVSRSRPRNFKLSKFFKGRNVNSDGLAFASQVCEANRDTNPIVVDISEATPSTSANC